MEVPSQVRRAKVYAGFGGMSGGERVRVRIGSETDGEEAEFDVSEFEVE